jgi:hypothetical protein
MANNPKHWPCQREKLAENAYSCRRNVQSDPFMPSILVVAAKMAGTVAAPSRFLRRPLGSTGCGGSLLGVFHPDLASFTGA